MFDANAIRCCIVADTFHVSGVIRSDTPVLERGRNDHLTVADILPIMCDVADYCILVIEPTDSLSSAGSIVRSAPFFSRTLTSRDTGSTAGGDFGGRAATPGAGDRAATPGAGETRIEDILVGHPASDKVLGPAVYLAGLSVLSLKSERQSYVQYGVDDDSDIPRAVSPLKSLDTARGSRGSCGDALLHSMVPYSQRFEKSPATLQLDSEVAGVDLHGGLLCLWALSVSHGSYGFVRDAAPVMAELGYLGYLRRKHWWSCVACRRRAGFTVSLSDDILQFFHRFREREPISADRHLVRSAKRSAMTSAPVHFREGESSLKARLGTTARAQLLHSLQACLTRRAMISRYLRLYGRTKNADSDGVSIASVCDTSARFTVPSSHPVAVQLHSVARDIDYMLDKGAGALLEQVQRYMTLEDFADRIQGFLVSYLRRMNGSGDKNLAHREQLAAFELYTAAAEGQGYLVDVVSDFLCNKAEMRGYQKVTKALSTPLEEITGEMSAALADQPTLSSLSEGEVCSIYAPLFVSVVGATHLPSVRGSWQATSTDELWDNRPTAYCTLGLEGTDTVLLQTGVAAQGSNPEWREGLEVKQYPQGKTLVFSVWHNDPESRDRFLGQALLPYASFGRQEFAGEVALNNGCGRPSTVTSSTISETPHAGTLTVRVSMTAPRRITGRFTRGLRSSGASGAARPLDSSPSRAVRRSGTLNSNGSESFSARDLSSPKSFELSETPPSADRFTSLGARTLAGQLLTVTEAHRKLERMMIQLVADAKDEAEQQGILGAAQVDQSLHRNPFWDLVEASTFRTLERRLWNRKENDHGDLAKSDRADMAEEVDQELMATWEDPFLIDHFEESLTRAVAQTRVMCDSFWIMHLVMLRLERSQRLVVLSRHSSMKTRRKAPAVVYTVRLKGNPLTRRGGPALNLLADGGDESSLLEVILVHKKIALVGQENRSAVKQMIAEMRTINSICRTLRLGDPDLHPSMWCISLRQLQDFAQEVEQELGTEAYRAASCADVVKKSIIEKTSAARTSYARMVNWQNLRQIDVFVSHCWGENFSAFVNSVVAALETRIQAHEVNLWICCFALFQNPQYEVVKKQVGTDLMDAPFEKALRFAREFLVVRNAECDMYTRAWCVFEIFRARQLDLKITVTGPDKFTNENVDILSCKATDADDEDMIKGAIEDANEVDELNKVVSEIKAMGGRQESNFPVVRI
jgi:hypothetical protein